MNKARKQKNQQKIQQKQKRAKIEKIFAIIIYALIILFFSAEMFMKPISGEDAHQAKCMSSVVDFSSYKTCVRNSLNNIPRLGQTIHTLIISSFNTLPAFGPETLYRLIDTLMCLGTIYLITRLAYGRKLKLSYQDSLTCALSTVVLIFSDFTQMFFNGFSNVHNYIPAVFFALLFFWQWFYQDEMTKKTNHLGFYYVLFFICAFVFGSTLELNPFIFLAMIIGGIIIALVHKTKIKQIGQYLLHHLPAILGVICGYIMLYVIGRGYDATIGRSGNYLNSYKISDLWKDPANAIPTFFHNTVVNYANYLPFLLIAVAALVILYQKHKKDTRNKLFTAIICYAVIYIAGCFSFDSIMWRITSSVFCLLLIPATFLLSEITAQLKGKWAIVCSIIVTVLFVGMNADNIAYHITANANTAAVVDRTKQLNCLSREDVKEHAIASRSKFFGFKHPENTFSNINENWYNSNYLIDGFQRYIIVDSCYMPNENTNEEGN